MTGNAGVVLVDMNGQHVAIDRDVLLEWMRGNLGMIYGLSGESILKMRQLYIGAGGSIPITPAEIESVFRSALPENAPPDESDTDEHHPFIRPGDWDGGPPRCPQCETPNQTGELCHRCFHAEQTEGGTG